MLGPAVASLAVAVVVLVAVGFVCVLASLSIRQECFVVYAAAASESSLASKRGGGEGCELSILRSRVLRLVFAVRRVIGCGAASNSFSWPSGFAASSFRSCGERSAARRA